MFSSLWDTCFSTSPSAKKALLPSPQGSSWPAFRNDLQPGLLLRAGLYKFLSMSCQGSYFFSTLAGHLGLTSAVVVMVIILCWCNSTINGRSSIKHRTAPLLAPFKLVSALPLLNTSLEIVFLNGFIFPSLSLFFFFSISNFTIRSPKVILAFLSYHHVSLPLKVHSYFTTVPHNAFY